MASWTAGVIAGMRCLKHHSIGMLKRRLSAMKPAVRVR